VTRWRDIRFGDDGKLWHLAVAALASLAAWTAFIVAANLILRRC
jgi:hypothetical protein